MAESLSRPCDPVENSALRKLRRELANDAAVDHFVADFLQLLDQRLDSLSQLLAQQRWEDAVTLLLTIETSGLMLGARELAAAAVHLREELGDPGSPRVPELLGQVLRAGAETKRLLDKA